MLSGAVSWLSSFKTSSYQLKLLISFRFALAGEGVSFHYTFYTLEIKAARCRLVV